MLDAKLQPRILDFGLSAADASRGHLAGTPPYMAPEQLDPARPIDARTDVYALGMILYEMLCGRTPSGQPPVLPIEIVPSVPAPLQAIALAAMEQDPARRYQSALDMASDLRRYLEGRRVLARPSVYGITLGARIQPHLDEIREWVRLRLVHPHEAERLREAYAALSAPEDDWILEGRLLTYAQIALYLGAFLLIAGSLFYFVAARWYENVHGVVGPFMALALPFLGLNAAAHLLYRREHKAVAVAFALGAVALLPLFLLIFFHEAQLFTAPPGGAGELFDRAVSNRQLQLTTLVACAWAGWLALRTRTAALSTTFTVLLFLVAIALAADFGLRTVLDDGRWDLVALRFVPLVSVYSLLGAAAERTTRPWLGRPLFVAAAAGTVVLLELVALDGRGLRHVGGFSLAPWQSPAVSDPTLLDTVAGMTLNGAAFYGIASLVFRRGTLLMRPAAQMLFTIAPFAMIHPMGYLVRTDEYSPRFDWAYAACALAIMLLSQRRQRRSFYYAGMLNLAAALYFIAAHRQWFERPSWALAVITAGLAALGVGFLLDRRRQRSAQGQIEV